VGHAVRAVGGDTLTPRESAGDSAGPSSGPRRRRISGESVRVTGRPVLKRRKTARAQLSSATTSRILGYLSRSALEPGEWSTLYARSNESPWRSPNRRRRHTVPLSPLSSNPKLSDGRRRRAGRRRPCRGRCPFAIRCSNEAVRLGALLSKS